MDEDLMEYFKKLEEEHNRYIECDKNLREVVQYIKHLKSVTLESATLWVVDHEKVKELTKNNKEFIKQNTILVSKMKEVRKTLYDRELQVSHVLKERNRLRNTLDTAKDILHDENTTTAVRAKLCFLNLNAYTSDLDKLDSAEETNITDLLMSELSWSREEDSSKNVSLLRSRANKRQPTSLASDELLNKFENQKSKGIRATSSRLADLDERVIATTCRPEPGPSFATSVMEPRAGTSKSTELYTDPNNLPSKPSSLLDVEYTSEETDRLRVTPKRPIGCRTERHHCWQLKSYIMGDSCSVCSKLIIFSTLAVKCSNCKGIAHSGCKDRVRLPCVPTYTPKTKSTIYGSIGDYVGETSPMVPALVVHCIREVEARGLNQEKLYLRPAPLKQVRTLKETLLKAKGVVDLSKIENIHTITGCLKLFLRSLNEQLLLKAQWETLASALDMTDLAEKKNKLLQTVSNLPQPNRDTLAYIILHLQRVAAASSCEMSIANLSKVFAPSIVGYSCHDSETMMMEITSSHHIMVNLLLLEAECWEKQLYPDNDENKDPTAVESCSQSNATKPRFFCDVSSRVRTGRKYKFFET